MVVTATNCIVSEDGNRAITFDMSDDDDDFLYSPPFSTCTNQLNDSKRTNIAYRTNDTTALSSLMAPKVTSSVILYPPPNIETSSNDVKNENCNRINENSNKRSPSNTLLTVDCKENGFRKTTDSRQESLPGNEEKNGDDEFLRNLLGNWKPNVDTKRKQSSFGGTFHTASHCDEIETESDDDETYKPTQEQNTANAHDIDLQNDEQCRNSSNKKRKVEASQIVIKAPHKNNKTKVIPVLTLDEKRVALSKIPSRNNRILQELLWQANFQFTLYPHQFEGIRAVAGLPSREQCKKLKRQHPPQSRSEDSIVPTTKGILLADDMVRLHDDALWKHLSFNN
jgi:hypothetical protein